MFYKSGYSSQPTALTQHVHLEILGDANGEKMSLASHWHEKTYSQNAYTYRFYVAEDEKTATDISIVAFDTVPICVVGTNIDALEKKVLHPDLRTLHDRRYFAYYYNTEYVPVNTQTGEGIRDLMQTIVEKLYPQPLLRSRTISDRLLLLKDAFMGLILDRMAALFQLPRPPTDAPICAISRTILLG